jgi:hypothetical protein
MVEPIWHNEEENEVEIKEKGYGSKAGTASFKRGREK